MTGPAYDLRHGNAPPGAFATPRGRLRVGWRGGSQLLQLRYNIDKIVTSQAKMPRRSSQNSQIEADRRVRGPAAGRGKLSTVLSTGRSTALWIATVGVAVSTLGT